MVSSLNLHVECLHLSVVGVKGQPKIRRAVLPSLETTAGHICVAAAASRVLVWE